MATSTTGTITGRRTTARMARRSPAAPRFLPSASPAGVPSSAASSAASAATATLVPAASRHSRSASTRPYHSKVNASGGNASQVVRESDIGMRATIGSSRNARLSPAAPPIARRNATSASPRPDQRIQPERPLRRRQRDKGGGEQHQAQRRGEWPVLGLAHVGLDQHGE